MFKALFLRSQSELHVNLIFTTLQQLSLKPGHL